jgi:hypothetical protein
MFYYKQNRTEFQVEENRCPGTIKVVGDVLLGREVQAGREVGKNRGRRTRSGNVCRLQMIFQMTLLEKRN